MKFRTFESIINRKFHTGIRKQKINQVARRQILEFFDVHDVPLLNCFAMKMLSHSSKSESRIISIYLRFILTRLFKFDPLEKFHPDTFSVAILVSAKDLLVLPYALYSLISLYSNSISSIYIVVPEDSFQKVQNRIEGMNFPLKIRYTTDEKILKKICLPEKFLFRTTVAKMEFIKFALPSSLGEENLLILDGDTIYLRGRTWKSGSNLTLMVAQEYMTEHIRFSQNYFSLKAKSGLGFVTHHSFFIREIIDDMAANSGGYGSLASALDEKISKGFSTGEFPSEWQSYGDWVVEKSNLMPRFAKFSNLGMPRRYLPLNPNANLIEIGAFLESVKKIVPKLGSLSLHDYK